MPRTEQFVETLVPGQSMVLDAQRLAGFLPDTVSASVSYSRWRGLDVPGLLRWLDRYPYGCLEQTVSRALPLLYFNDVALLAGAKQDRRIEARVADAVEAVLAMQTTDGDFRMWGQWGADAPTWVSIFALDFLHQAADRGFDVPSAALASGRNWLARVPNGYDVAASDAAYAALVLAKSGRISPGDLRALSDTMRPLDPLPLAQLGLALESIGERARARDAFEGARRALARWTAIETSQAAATSGELLQIRRRIDASYGSRLRDAFGTVAQLAAAGYGAQVPAIIEAAGWFDPRIERTTTQEKAWMLLAAAALARNAGQVAVSVDGVSIPAGDPASRSIEPAGLARGVEVRNNGGGEVFQTMSVEGVPSEPLPPLSASLDIVKRFATLQGVPVDLDAVRRNDRIVVRIALDVRAAATGSYAVIDLLPAGFEIEGTLRPDQPGFDWLGKLNSASLQQARDDRYVAAVEVGRETREVVLAYVVRAVTPGRFVLPAAAAENMYVPDIAARTVMGRVAISE